MVPDDGSVEIKKPPKGLRRGDSLMNCSDSVCCDTVLEVAKEFVEACSWEVASWAGGWGEVFVEEYLVSWDVEFFGECGDNLCKIADLFIG